MVVVMVGGGRGTERCHSTADREREAATTAKIPALASCWGKMAAATLSVAPKAGAQVLVTDNFNPQSFTAWLFAAAKFVVVGWVFFWVVGGLVG